MTEIKVVRYRKGDAFRLPGHMREAYAEQLDNAFLSGEAFTGMAEGVLAFCCGICLYWAGHAEVWLIMGYPADKYIASFKIIRDLLERMIQKHNLFSLTAHCDKNWEAANRIVRHLGFSLEASLRNYGPQRETYNLYGRIL
jgi:hypothetical protein